MTPEEILEYNKRCAEFLKDMKYIKAQPDADYSKYKNLEHMYKVDTSQYITPFSKELTSKINHTIIGEVSLSYMIDLTELKFHSDWNWIMEVVEAIERLGKNDFQVNIFINVANIRKFNKKYGCYENFQYSQYSSKKEAIVQAINQFLIWYEQNKTK